MVDNVVDAAEVVGGLHDVVDVEDLFLAGVDSDRVCFEDITRLVVGEPAAFDVIGVEGQVNLRAMVDAAARLAFFFFAKSCQKGGAFLFVGAVRGQGRIGRDVPGLAGKECAVNLSCGAPVPDSPFRQFVLFSKS